MIPVLLVLALGAAPASLTAPGFGKVPVFAPEGAPRRVIVLLSGSRGWGDDLDALARALAARGALVAGVDVPAHLRLTRAARCAYPAADLETLAQLLQKRAGLPAYQRPLVVGHSLGASVGWAAFAEAPGGTFSGAVLVGLCPALPVPARLCRGSGPPPQAVEGGQVVPAAKHLEQPLALVSGAEDRECPAAGAEAFAKEVPGAFEAVPGLGHRLVPAAAWADAITRRAEVFEAAAAPAPAAVAPAPPHDAPSVKDLPLVENPAPGEGKRLAVMLTGDGGWVGLDKHVASALVAAGVPVIGLDSLKYFWSKKKPAQAAADVARIIAHYRAAWGKDEVILIGYSRGADVVPFLPPGMPVDARAAVKLLVLLGPETYAEFEVHVVDIFASIRRSAATSTQKAVEALGGSVKLLCVQGSDEQDSLCPRIEGRPEVERVVLPGGHHFDRDYAKLARIIVEAAP